MRCWCHSVWRDEKGTSDVFWIFGFWLSGWKFRSNASCCAWEDFELDFTFFDDNFVNFHSKNRNFPLPWNFFLEFSWNEGQKSNFYFNYASLVDSFTNSPWSTDLSSLRQFLKILGRQKFIKHFNFHFPIKSNRLFVSFHQKKIRKKLKIQNRKKNIFHTHKIAKKLFQRATCCSFNSFFLSLHPIERKGYRVKNFSFLYSTLSHNFHSSNKRYQMGLPIGLCLRQFQFSQFFIFEKNLILHVRKTNWRHDVCEFLLFPFENRLTVLFVWIFSNKVNIHSKTKHFVPGQIEFEQKLKFSTHLVLCFNLFPPLHSISPYNYFDSFPTLTILLIVIIWRVSAKIIRSLTFWLTYLHYEMK